MPSSETSEKIVFDLDQLWALLPRRMPGRVTEIWVNGSGIVTPLIPVIYPNGQRMDRVYCSDLSGVKEKQEVIFEYKPSRNRFEKEKQKQPNLVEVAHFEAVMPGEVDQLIAQYLSLFGSEMQNQLREQLKSLMQERERVAATVEERVKAIIQSRNQDLDERESALFRKEHELQTREATLEDTIETRVEELLAKRRLELDRREASLQKKEVQLAEQNIALTQQRREFEADRTVFVTEGGQAFIEYLQSNGLTATAEENPTPIEPSEKPLNISNLTEQLKQSGYDIDAQLLEQALISMLAAWSSGQFVILAGPTGVGKTQLIQQLANIIGAGHSITSVRPGWIEPSDLLGFYNPTRKLFEPTPVLDCLIKARTYSEAGRFYLLCLDEMNLSRVENYAADLLSQLEQVSAGQPARLDLYSQEVSRRLADEQRTLQSSADSLTPEQIAYLRSLQRQLTYYRPQLEIASGLTLFGTVNVDETTHIFSPKFLDRAYVLRFPPATLPKDLKAPLLKNNGLEGALWPLSLEKSANILRQDRIFPKQAEDIWLEFLQWQQEYLVLLDVHLGHRFYANFRRYLTIGINLLPKPDLRSVAEGYFLAKTLPRIRFHVDERALTNQHRKSEVVQEWAQQLDRSYPRLHNALTAMLARSASRGMVEYWD